MTARQRVRVTLTAPDGADLDVVFEPDDEQSAALTRFLADHPKQKMRVDFWLEVVPVDEAASTDSR